MSRYRNVELVVKTLHLHDEINDDILRGKVAELMEQIEKDDRITVMDTVLTEHDMQQLIMECDAFISLHRSEGFGLNLARAIASGIPLVATDYSGNAEWMEHSWRVDWRPEQLKEHDYYPKGSWWAEPDIECAAKYLREIHDKPKKARKRAERARLAHDFSLDTLAFRMRELLSQSGFMPTRTGLPGAASIHSHPRT